MLRKLHAILLCATTGGSIGVGCRAESERLPFVEPCTDCPASQTGSGVMFGGGGGAASAADAGGGVASGAGVMGFVSVLVAEDLRQAFLLSGMEVEITAPAQAGGVVSTINDGSEPYLLEGIASANPTWVTVTDNDGQELMPTVQAVDPGNTANQSLLVVQRQIMESLAISAPISAPTDLDPLRGHLALFITDPAGNPVVGVSLDSALGLTVAYDAGDMFSNQPTETDERGAILVLNIPALAVSGSDELVTLSDDQGSFGARVRVVRNALTVAFIVR